jgi:hypothetical protein
MTRSPLYLLDTGVIIELFRLSLWQRVVEVYQIYVSETVASEALYYSGPSGRRVPIRLQKYVEEGRISLVSVDAKEVSAFLGRFGVDYAERLDPGELESLAYLFSSSEEILICSADSIVYLVLGATDRRDSGISLEEILTQCGLGRGVPWQFSAEFRNKYTSQGFRDQLLGFGPDNA